jgi:hypothetical protein
VDTEVGQGKPQSSSTVDVQRSSPRTAKTNGLSGSGIENRTDKKMGQNLQEGSTLMKSCRCTSCEDNVGDCQQEILSSSATRLPSSSSSVLFQAAHRFVQESSRDLLFRERFTELDCTNWAFYYDMFRDQMELYVNFVVHLP